MSNVSAADVYLDGPENRLISYRPDPAELIGLANIKENKWRDLYWCMEDSLAHGFGCH